MSVVVNEALGLAAEMVELDAKIKDVKRSLDELADVRAALEEQLLEQFVESGSQSVNVNGRTVGMRRDVYAKILDPERLHDAWFADALRDGAQEIRTEPINFAVQNDRGIRVPLFGKGPVTVGKMYELMPFDNVMYILKLKGTDVKMLFDKMAESGGWPVSRNVSFRIEYGKAENIRIKGAALDTTAVYTAAIPDYIANGGDNMIFLKNLPSVNTGVLLRDMLIKNGKDLQAIGESINPQEDQRITE